MSPRRFGRPGLRSFVSLSLLLVAALALAAAAGLDYRLEPLRVADDTYVFVGEREDFSVRNGGNIVNTGFVVTGDGVVVIDTGPTRRYGEAMRQAIAKVTDQPLREVWITHHHPDHFLGNQAFADLPIGALETSTQGMRDEGQAFAANVYRLTGDWAKGTEPLPANRSLTGSVRSIGQHRFRLLPLAGHTGADLAVFDETSGVLFAGDLVFHQRTPTTPHADIAGWLAALDQLAALPFRVIVPGHGPAASTPVPIEQTRAWLQWVDRTLKQAAADGLDPAEIMALPIPPELSGMALVKAELARSIAHLFRRLESRALGPSH